MQPLAIDLLAHQTNLRLEKQEGIMHIYGLARKKFLKATPEEVVRQLMLLYLTQEKGYPLGRIRTEKGLQVNQMQKRCDILVYNDAFEPLMLIECKAATVNLDSSTLTQVGNYNKTLQAPYWAITNGPLTYCCQISDKQLTNCIDFPDYAAIR